MKILALVLLILAAAGTAAAARAAPTVAQAEDVREAVFRALLVRAGTAMPEAKVAILQAEGPPPPQWWGDPHSFDPSADLLRRLAGTVPRVVPFSRSGGGASEEGTWHQEYATGAHGPVLQILSLLWIGDTAVEVETYTDPGLPRRGVSRPYLVTRQGGTWAAREDVGKEWWQATHEGDIREAATRYELAQGTCGMKSAGTPCFLSFGGLDASPGSDPPGAFMERLRRDGVRVQQASRLPDRRARKPWMIFSIYAVRWISDTEAEVDGAGTAWNFLSTDSTSYRMVYGAGGWKVTSGSSFSA